MILVFSTYTAVTSVTSVTAITTVTSVTSVTSVTTIFINTVIDSITSITVLRVNYNPLPGGLYFIEDLQVYRLLQFVMILNILILDMIEQTMPINCYK